ncbi:MAG: hypothetical protein KIT43_09970 [Bauldia sp.]|nr:hypothetical protein [Bauldia sp.]MCW5718787.1 hypothetical protein [Bauldia sp.]
MAIDTRGTENDRDQYGRPVHAETGSEARQGPLGRPVLYVLLGGLALAALYLIGTMIWSNTEDLPPPNQIQTQPVEAAPAVNLTPADPVITPAPADPAITPAPAETPAPALTPDPAPITPAPAPPAG